MGHILTKFHRFPTCSFRDFVQTDRQTHTCTDAAKKQHGWRACNDSRLTGIQAGSRCRYSLMEHQCTCRCLGRCHCRHHYCISSRMQPASETRISHSRPIGPQNHSLDPTPHYRTVRQTIPPLYTTAIHAINACAFPFALPAYRTLFTFRPTASAIWCNETLSTLQYSAQR